MRDVFKGKSAILITKHGKEKAIAPVLRDVLNMHVTSTNAIDTDQYGTFSGTVERMGSQNEAAMHKIQAGISKLGSGIYLASEGAFYPHPEIPFLTVNTELVVLYDELNKLKITGSHTSVDVKIISRKIKTRNELQEVVKLAEFPDNKLIVKNENTGEAIVNINSYEELLDAFEKTQRNTNEVLVETDLRANRNTWRLKNIEKASFDLALKMDCFCPSCEKPGFSVTSVNRGLECSHCKLPTNEIKEYVFTCEHCNHTHLKNLFSLNKRADASLCNFCNP